MKERLQIRKKADSSPAISEESELLSRSLTNQAKQQSHTPVTQTEIENQEFQQNQVEATKLQLQAKYGNITPEAQERLTVLQAKMNGLLLSRVEQGSRFGHNFANIAVNRGDAASAATPELIGRVESAKTTAPALDPKKAKFLQDYALAERLVSTIDDKLPQDKILEQLFKNFGNIGFNYTMVNKSHKTLLEGTLEGDCQTLARAFKFVAEEYFGIGNITIESIQKPFLSEAGKTPYRGREPNCDDGKRWFFQNHYWAVWNGKVFDVLFLTDKRTEADKAKQDKPLQSMLMPEEDYYETEKGKIVYPYRNKYLTAELTMFEKLKYFVNNLGKWLARDMSSIVNKIQGLFSRGGNNNGDFESLMRELDKQKNSAVTVANNQNQ